MSGWCHVRILFVNQTVYIFGRSSSRDLTMTFSVHYINLMNTRLDVRAEPD